MFRFSIVSSWVLIAVIYAWLVSAGSFSMLHRESRSVSFDSLGTHLLLGSAEVDHSAIEIESFQRDGKVFMYFGPFPAFLRIIPNQLFPDLYGLWPRWSCLTAALLSLFAFYIFCKRALITHPSESLSRSKKILLYMSLLGFGLGSPIVYLVSCGYIYHESMVWGICWTLWGIFFWWRSLENCATKNNIIYLSCCAGLALLSRATIAFPLFALLGIQSIRWIYANRREQKKNYSSLLSGLSLIAIPVCTAVCFQLWYNYERFGSPFCFIDLSIHETLHIQPEYMRQLNELGVFNLVRLAVALKYYIGFGVHYFQPTAPFIIMSRTDLPSTLYPIGYVEWTLPLYLSSPWILFGAILGWVSLAHKKMKEWRIVLCSLVFLFPVFMICSFYYITQRYLTEFLPLLICAWGCLLRYYAINDFSLTTRRVLIPILTAACLWSCSATLLTALYWNVEYNWAAPSDYKELLKSYFSIVDSYLLNKPL